MKSVTITTLSIILASASVPAQGSDGSSASDFSDFRFWLLESGDEVCKLGGKFYIDQLYRPLSMISAPKFDWHIDGQPNGPTFQVNVEAMALGPERCYWRIESRVVSFEKKGYNSANSMVEYYKVGPIRSFGSRSANDLRENILGQVNFFMGMWAKR